MTAPVAVLTEAPPEVARALARRAADLARRHDLTGLMVGVVHDQHLIWSLALGSPDRARPLDAHTRARVASITKTFTAAAIVRLRDAGLLGLDDPLVAHVPELRAVRNPFGPIEAVTLRLLLSHHAGLMGEPPLGHWASLRFPTRAEVMASLPRVEVVIPPGSAFKYSNLGYTLLGEVIERASGRPVLDYLAAELLEPLGMRESGFAPDRFERDSLAAGHGPHPHEDHAAPAPPSPTNGMAAAAELYTTVHDLARWIGLQFRARAGHEAATEGSATEDGGIPLSPTSLAEMHRPQCVEPDWRTGYCIGWRANRSGERIWLGHGGALPGFRSQILFNVPARVGAIVLIDGIGPADTIALELADAAADLLADVVPAPPLPAPRPTPAHLRRFLGLYRIVHFGDLARIEYRGGRLVLLGAAIGPGPVNPPSPLDPTDTSDVFIVRAGRYAGETMIFTPAEDGRVASFTSAGFTYTHLADADGNP